MSGVLPDPRLCALLLFVLCVLISFPALASEPCKAKVVGISDGDTITVLRGHDEIKIRLHGVDSPELGQAFGKAAKECCSKLAFKKTVEIIPVDTDRYGRTVARVMLSRKKSLNAEMVRAGMAWWFRRYAPDDKKLERAEMEARAQKRGLWSDPKAIPPFEYRHPGTNVGEGVGQKSGITETAGTVFVTKHGECYHRAGCEALHGAGTEIRFTDALARGLRPCGVCRPTDGNPPER